VFSLKKLNVLWILVDLIFLAVFNVAFYVIGGLDHSPPIWISYAFIHFSYLMLLITPYLVRGGKNSAVFGFSLYSVSAAYFLVEFVTGVVIILLSPEGYKAALLIQLFIAAFYAAILIANMIANEHTADSVEERQYGLDYIKRAAAEMEALLNSASDRQVKKQFEKILDAIRASPVKTHPSVTPIEMRIFNSIGDMRNLAGGNDGAALMEQSEALLSLIAERNRQLKTLH
jgi:hypothetical protein